jgi:[ribosomal protein S5]-alanine N-acetyltransferase
MFPLKTQRLLLRHFQIEDLEQIHGQVFSDAEVMRFGDGPQTKEWVHQWLVRHIDGYKIHGYGPYVVIEQKAQKMIGYCGLFYFPDINGNEEVEIGYRLACSSWGQGYATEAASAVRDFAWKTLHLSRLVSLIDPSNIASIHVVEKLGMQYESAVMLEGYDHPDHLYTLNT